MRSVLIPISVAHFSAKVNNGPNRINFFGVSNGFARITRHSHSLFIQISKFRTEYDEKLSQPAMEWHVMIACSQRYKIVNRPPENGIPLLPIGVDEKKSDTLILKGMQIFHNYVRPHESLKGRTPSEAAGIQVEGKNKWITIIQNASRK
jgi:hypothetical protein